MRSIKLFIFSLLVAMFLPEDGSAQRDLYNWQISPYAGLMTINNDIEVPSDANSYAYGLRIERRMGNSFSLGLHLTQLEIGDAQKNNASGSFLSLGYHWDNGYLSSERAAVSIFHRIDAGYTDRYENIESIDDQSGDLTFGFENGLKFRFGDRITADVALELFSTKANLTEGDILKNVRYNVWKFGLNYHFGNRKSAFVAPVFVPDNGIKSTTTFNKIGSKDVNIIQDSLYNDELMGGIRDTLLIDSTAVRSNATLTRADSLLIFMYFDSLYQRKARPANTSVTSMDSTLTDDYNAETMRDTIAMRDSVVIGDATLPVDSVVISDTLAVRDSTMLRSAKKDSVSTNEIKIANRRDSLITRVDSVYIEQSVPTIQKADSAKSFTTIPNTRVDTVYIEKPISIEQQSDTSAVFEKSKTRDDLVNNEKDEKSEDNTAEDSNEEPDKVVVQKSNNSTTDAYQESLDRQSDLLTEQNREIQKNRQEIQKLKKENNKGDAGKIIAAGAAGTALGALVSRNKSKTDTVYYESGAAQQELERVEAELAALKLEYGINDSTAVINTTAVVDSALVGDSTYVVNPPIGSYFNNDSLSVDSTEAIINDTLIRPTLSDTLTELDSLSTSAIIDSTSAQPADTAAVAKSKPIVKNEPLTEPVLSGDTLNGIYPIACTFGLNKTSLDELELQKLDVVVQDLKNDDSRNVLLTGYTDKSGDAAYNLQLSKKRAAAVMDYLILKGISKERIETKGGGVKEGAEKFQENSRRVEVSIVEA